MSEYLKLLSDKCNSCQKYHCLDTELFVTTSEENPENRKVGRVLYDEKYSKHEHELPISKCPTKNIIDETQKRVGKGLRWKFVENSTIERALKSLDKPVIGYSGTMLITESNTSQNK